MAPGQPLIVPAQVRVDRLSDSESECLRTSCDLADLLFRILHVPRPGIGAGRRREDRQDRCDGHESSNRDSAQSASVHDRTLPPQPVPVGPNAVCCQEEKNSLGEVSWKNGIRRTRLTFGDLSALRRPALVLLPTRESGFYLYKRIPRSIFLTFFKKSEAGEE